jgi:hypothetical protein
MRAKIGWSNLILTQTAASMASIRFENSAYSFTDQDVSEKKKRTKHKNAAKHTHTHKIEKNKNK